MLIHQSIQDAALQEGRVFAGGSAGSLAAAAAIIYRLLPGAKGGKLKLTVAAAADAFGEAALSIGITFGGTTSASGVSAPLANQNQISSATTTTTLHSAPTVTGAGTSFTIGVSGVPLEVILAPSVLYLVTITNPGAAGIDFIARFELTE